MNKNIFLYIQDNLLKFYKKEGRDFPWRYTSDPYAVMIAEFMLQRTRAEQVVSVYKEFMKKYPDVNSLSQASLSEIREMIYPLGLHWRTFHFLKAARYIVNHCGGKIPAERKELLKIPGIGDYIAGAILVVAYKKREYVVDSNIARFLNRFFDLRLSGEIRRNSVIRELAVNLFWHQNPEKILFSVLDFTAAICVPHKPQCNICFLKDKCKYYSVNKTVEKFSLS